MKAYYINLDRSPGRRRFIKAQLSDIPSERIRAVKGSSLIVENVAVMDRVKDWPKLLTPNAGSGLAALRR